MTTRVHVIPERTGVHCGICGRATIHLAKLLASDGRPIGHTVVCTSCHPHPQTQDGAQQSRPRVT